MVEYRNILFATDFSEDANIAFLHALDLGRKYGAKLHIFHVPHSSYAYTRHVVDEHVPGGSPGGEAFYDEKVEKAALEAMKTEYGAKLGDFQNALFIENSFLVKLGYQSPLRVRNIDTLQVFYYSHR